MAARRFAIPGLAVLAILLALAVVPAFHDLALMNVLIKVFIAALFALAFNLLWGQGGLLSFGHATYFAIGTFGAIYMMVAIEKGFPFPTPLVPLAGAAAAFLFGLVAGWFATIRGGVYFAMITVALSELVAGLAEKWDSLFGGESGIRSERLPWGPFGLQSTEDVYLLVLLWTILGALFLLWVQRSPWGLVLRGVRDREERVRFLGYNDHAVKTLAFAISAAVSGLAGGLLALSDESANMVLFQGSESTFVVLNTVIGGAGVFIGPIIGAALTTLFSYYVASATHFWMLYLGLLFITLVLFAPHGLAGMVAERSAAVRRGERRWIGGADVRRWLGMAALAAIVVLIAEIVGAVVAPEYRAQVRALGGQWPSVRVFAVGWSPTGPTPWLGAVALGAVCWALLSGRLARGGGR